jgi:3-hydroxybutyryl-CoA dehydrogenase
MHSTEPVAILGAGVIGASWAALVLASGRDAVVYDPVAETERNVRAYIDETGPTLEALGLSKPGRSGRLSFTRSASDAVRDAAFVQENVPERIAIKHALFGEIEPALRKDAIVASSASGLTLTQLQGGWRNPQQLVLGHPFNPPHLIPLVEVMGNERTAEGVVARAEAFYKGIGKITIRVNREVPGHVANRLQAAVWREAIHLVNSGVASVADVDTAMWAGPGLRWAAMGPTMLFHLGAGEGGLKTFCERYSQSFNTWWDDLGVLHFNQDIADKIVSGLREEAGDRTHGELTRQRDGMIAAIQLATAKYRQSDT